MSVESRLTFSLIEPSRRKENTDMRLVVEFPKSRVLTPDVAVGQPGQLARFIGGAMMSIIVSLECADQGGRRSDLL